MLKQEELLDMRKRILGGYEPDESEIEQILLALQAKRATSTAAGSTTRAKKPKVELPADLNELFAKKEDK